MMPEVALLAKRGWLPLIMRLVVSQYLYLGTVGIVQSHGRTDGNTHKLVQYFYFFDIVYLIMFHYYFQQVIDASMFQSILL